MSRRTESKCLREEYLLRNWQCEFPDCHLEAVEVDHIVQCMGTTYETQENYFATCRPCHDRKHRENLRRLQIEVKIKKGEWFETEDDERIYFGRLYRV